MEKGRNENSDACLQLSSVPIVDDDCLDNQSTHSTEYEQVLSKEIKRNNNNTNQNAWKQPVSK